jgi:hypothetical protein
MSSKQIREKVIECRKTGGVCEEKNILPVDKISEDGQVQEAKVFEISTPTSSISSSQLEIKGTESHSSIESGNPANLASEPDGPDFAQNCAYCNREIRAGASVIVCYACFELLKPPASATQQKEELKQII